MADEGFSCFYINNVSLTQNYFHYLKVKRLKKRIALYETSPITELRGVTCQCHTGSHSVTCHPTQVNAPHLNPSQ